MSTDAKETSYQLAQEPVIVQGQAHADVFNDEGTFPLGPGQKRGHRCCVLGCSNVKLAVVVVNMVNIVWLVFCLASMIALEKQSATARDEFSESFASFCIRVLAVGIVI